MGIRKSEEEFALQALFPFQKAQSRSELHSD
jgi:hypothetical protein